MRGEDNKQEAMFSYVSPERRVPTDHPLRPIRAMVDGILKEMSPQFAKRYADVGRPSIVPPTHSDSSTSAAIQTWTTDWKVVGWNLTRTSLATTSLPLKNSVLFLPLSRAHDGTAARTNVRQKLHNFLHEILTRTSLKFQIKNSGLRRSNPEVLNPKCFMNTGS